MTSRIRIFVVDDEKDLTDLLHYQLGKEGFEVKFSNNPFEALGKARDFNPDLIILDVMMPDLDGFNFEDDPLGQPVAKSTRRYAYRKSEVEHRSKDWNKVRTTTWANPSTQGTDLADQVHFKTFGRSIQRFEFADHVGKMVLDEEDHSISIAGEKIDFTLTEFKLIHYFSQTKRKSPNKGQLASWSMEIRCRGRDPYGGRHPKSRKKIANSGVEIETIRGVGYRLSQKSV